jgi:hypothetical protein
VVEEVKYGIVSLVLQASVSRTSTLTRRLAMTFNEYTAFGVLIIAVIGITLRVGFSLNRKVSYESLDRCKKEVMDSFVSRDVCDVLHSSIKEDIIEIKKDVKELLRKANGVK